MSWSRNRPVDEEMASLGGGTAKDVVFGVCSGGAVSQRSEGSLAGEVLCREESQAQGKYMNKFARTLNTQSIASSPIRNLCDKVEPPPSHNSAHSGHVLVPSSVHLFQFDSSIGV